MRAAILLLLSAAGCASVKPALTVREGDTDGGGAVEEAQAAVEASVEDRGEAAMEHVAMAPMPAPAPPRPVAAMNRAHAARSHPVEAPPTPGALEGASVASVVLHTPAGDMEVKCPSVCPPGQSCVQPAPPPGPGDDPGIPEVGLDLLKEVLTPLAAAIGGMLAGLFIKKGRKK